MGKLTIALLIAGNAFGQYGGGGGAGGLASSTFASLPVSPALNTAYLVTDASATGVCGGGGSAFAVCVWNGSTYVAVTGASTGLGDPGSNSIPFRNGSGTTIPATATQLSGPHFCSDSGSTDAYACNLSPAIASYTAGTMYWFFANTVNTGAASINFNAKGTLALKKMIGGINTDLSTGDIAVGQWVGCVYDGTNCQMATQLGNGVAVAGRSTVLAQSTSQSAVTLATSPVAGEYDIHFYSNLNTPCTTGSNSVSFTFSWTDASNSRVLSTSFLALGTQTTGRYMSGIVPVHVGSGNVTYSSAVIGTCTSGTSTYDVDVWIIRVL